MTQKERKELFNQGLKKCSKCGVVKSLDEFNNNKNIKDGKNCSCKKCCKGYDKEYKKNNKEKQSKYQKEYYQNNKEEILKNNKEYKKNNKEKQSKYQKEYHKNNKEKRAEYDKNRYQNNKEEITESSKEYKKNNKEKVAEYLKEYNNLFSKSKKYFNELLKYEDVKWSKEGYIQVRCKKCNEYFKPNNSQIKNRIACINGNVHGESNLYCSENCKKTCEIFAKKFVTPGLEQFDSRELQGEWAKEVKERDNYKCQICGSQENLHAHHIEAHAVTYDSFDLDNGITLCINCHYDVHQLPGCTLGDIKNQKQNCNV